MKIQFLPVIYEHLMKGGLKEEHEFCSEPWRYCLQGQASWVCWSDHLSFHNPFHVRLYPGLTHHHHPETHVSSKRSFSFLSSRHTSCIPPDNLTHRHTTIRSAQVNMVYLNFWSPVWTTIMSTLFDIPAPYHKVPVPRWDSKGGPETGTRAF